MIPSVVSLTRIDPSIRGAEAARLTPSATVNAVIDWPSYSVDEEGDVAPDVVDDLCRALLKCGRIAFRWDGEPPSGERRMHPRPSVSFASKLVGRFIPELMTPKFGVLTTSDPDVARSLFSYGGWTMGVQAVLAFAPGPVDPPDVISRLQYGLDWRDEPLPTSARLLFGPGHDGAFAVLATRTLEDCDRFASALKNQ